MHFADVNLGHDLGGKIPDIENLHPIIFIIGFTELHYKLQLVVTVTKMRIVAKFTGHEVR